MNKSEILTKYTKQEDKLLVSKLIDKIEQANKTNKIKYTDFLNNFDSSYANFPFDILTIKEFINNYPTSELSTWDVVFINGESKKTFCLDKNKENDAFITLLQKKNQRSGLHV